MVSNAENSFMLSARRATVDDSMFILGTVTNNPATAVIALWGEKMDRTLEAVECVCLLSKDHVERSSVFIATYFALRHDALLCSARVMPPRHLPLCLSCIGANTVPRMERLMLFVS